MVMISELLPFPELNIAVHMQDGLLGFSTLGFCLTLEVAVPNAFTGIMVHVACISALLSPQLGWGAAFPAGPRPSRTLEIAVQQTI
jgi:hypothetical protein